MFDIFPRTENYITKPKARLWTSKTSVPDNKEQELINARVYLLLSNLYNEGKLEAVYDPEIEGQWNTLSTAQKQHITITIYGLTGKFFMVSTIQGNS